MKEERRARDTTGRAKINSKMSYSKEIKGRFLSESH